jgi:hypothetical protein
MAIDKFPGDVGCFLFAWSIVNTKRDRALRIPVASTSEMSMTFRLPLCVQNTNSVAFQPSLRGALKRGNDSDWLNLNLSGPPRCPFCFTFRKTIEG